MQNQNKKLCSTGSLLQDLLGPFVHQCQLVFKRHKSTETSQHHFNTVTGPHSAVRICCQRLQYAM